MSKNYTQLDLVQRYQIEAFLQPGMKQKDIVATINVHPTTISRELTKYTAKRGRMASEYVAINAQRKTEQRYLNKPKAIKFSTKLNISPVDPYPLRIIRSTEYFPGPAISKLRYISR